MTKRWNIQTAISQRDIEEPESIVKKILASRGITKQEYPSFINPVLPEKLSVKDFRVNALQLKNAVKRIKKAIETKESIVVYGDYDADGVTASSILWETLYKLGASCMPYIPHRVEEGYGLSKTGIETIRMQYKPTLLITVDHGITAKDKVAYAQNLGIDVIVSDHHAVPAEIPDCSIVHTTKTSGAGVSWLLAREVFRSIKGEEKFPSDYLALASIGIIADLLPLVGLNRSLVHQGLIELQKTKRIGLLALFKDAGVSIDQVGTYAISHAIAPRINAMGRLVHAMDALRLLCTTSQKKADELASKISLTNRDRQLLTEESTALAKIIVEKKEKEKRLRRGIVIADSSFNQGIIGLVAGKLVEEYYRPSIVIARGEFVSKASARSIHPLNIIEVIRSLSSLIGEAGGHPLAAGFSIETKNIEKFIESFESLVDKKLQDEDLVKELTIDAELPFQYITESLWKIIQKLTPFGFGNPEPVFATHNVYIAEKRQIGKDLRHLKLTVYDTTAKEIFDAVGFGMGEYFTKITKGQKISIAYSIDMNVWNGKKNLQLKLKDIN